MKKDLPESDFSVNERIRKVREAKGLRQDEFADGINMSRTYISTIETNGRVVKDRVIKLICFTYGVSEKWLRSGAGEMFDKAQDNRIDRIIQIFQKLDDNAQDYIIKMADQLLEYRKKIGKK
jgi:transcriptional regulator with XRE-family HTH domain